MFEKTGAVFAISSVRRINHSDDWIKTASDLKRSRNVSNIEVNNNQGLVEGTSGNVVCDIDPEKFIYIHTTIMASVDLEDPKGHYITRETEKYINSNGDAWERSVLLNDYKSFIESGIVFVEHDQNPERAKGKVLDAIARDMGDTVLIDLLFCVDKRHEDLVANIENNIANAVSMGCTTGYIICSICGKKAHDKEDYCTHIAKQKNQMVKCADGRYRKAAELCYNNVFFDCSIVANPAFAGAVFRKIVASNKVASELLSNLLVQKISDDAFRDDLLSKFASFKESGEQLPGVTQPPENKDQSRFLKERDDKVENMRNDTAGTNFPLYAKNASHPLLHGLEADYEVNDHEFDDIPWHNPFNTLPVFDEQQPEGMKVMDAGKKKKRASLTGRLVRIKSDFLIPKEHRKTSMIINALKTDMVGRIVKKDASGATFTIYFPQLGAITGIPSSVVTDYQDEYDSLTGENPSLKQASSDDLPDEGKDGILKNHKGAFVGSEDRFQVTDFDDKFVTVRLLSGPHMGEQATFPKSEFSKSKVKWATVKRLASFTGEWNNKFYSLKTASWNEKEASLLDRYENHIDNIQNDITCVMPLQKGQYSRSFKFSTRFDGTDLQFNASVNNNKIQVDVDVED